MNTTCWSCLQITLLVYIHAGKESIFVAVSCLIIIENNVLFLYACSCSCHYCQLKFYCVGPTHLYNDKHSLGIGLRSLLSVLLLSI